jgi:hypothetical protein
VASIGNNAFYGCTDLTNATIGGGVINIGAEAFSTCTSLTRVTIGSGVSHIGEDAFYRCQSLVGAYFLGNAPRYSGRVFAGDYYATVYYVSGTTGWGPTFDGLPTAASVPYTYTTDNGAVSITGYTGLGGAVTLPGTIYGLPVTSIGDQAFVSCTNLTSVIIPDSVIHIGGRAFDNCTGLTSLLIPDSVTALGGGAFYNCSNLADIIIGASVAGIGDYAFYGCSSLTSVCVRGSAPTIGSSVFTGDDSATVYYLPGTTGWGPTLGGVPAVLWAPPVPYTYTTNNRTIAITGYTGSGGAVTIPGAINFLPVTSLGDGAFVEYRLTSVMIPASITSIRVETFRACSNLAAITVDALNPCYCSVGSVLFNKSQTTLIEYPRGKAGSYAIPDSITSIGDWKFAHCAGLTSITMGNSVTNIGNCAFYDCPGLTSVAIGNSVTSIRIWTFGRCLSLTNVTIPRSVTRIGDLAFDNCLSLASVTIPDTVTSIGDYTFQGCTSLGGVYFQGNAPSAGSFMFVGAGNPSVYYLPGTTGWGSPFDGITAVVWTPQIQTGDGSFGVRTNQFGFTITWASDLVVVVEACTNLANPLWSPVGTNTLTNGSSYFSDPQWTNYPSRLYGLRSP